MKKKRIFIISAVVCLATALAFFGRRRTGMLQSDASHIALMSQLAEQGRLEHPGLVFYDGTNGDENPYVAKEQLVEMGLEELRKEAKKKAGMDDLPKGAEEKLRKQLIDLYNKVVERDGRPPLLSDISFSPRVTRNDELVMADYDGPQTVEALMAEFDENYSRVHTPHGSEIDKIFPRDEWIQRALDLGVVFLDNYDYSEIMQLRGYMARIRRNPMRHAEIIQANGLEDDANYNAYIDEEILNVAQDNIMWRDAMRKDPDSTGGFRLGNRYIATRGNQVHVKIDPGDPGHAVVMYGPRDRDLTEQEKHALYYHGVAPKGIEVFYIDENDEVMPPGSEPMRLDWKDKVAAMQEHERQKAFQEAVDFLNSDMVNQMTIVDWMTMADFTGALLDYTEGGRTGVSAAPPGPPVPPTPSGVAAPSESPSSAHEQPLPPLLPSGVALPKSPGRSAEDVDAFFQFLDLHLIENADVPEEVRRGLKHRYEAYQMWRQQDRLRRQEQDSLRRQEPPANEDGESSDDDEDE